MYNIDMSTEQFGVHFMLDGYGASREILTSIHVWELCEALSKIYGSRNRQRSSWMHPSCVQRIAAIRRLV